MVALSANKQQDSSIHGEQKTSRKGCLGLMLAALAFIVLVYGIIIAYMTTHRTDEQKVNELQSIRQCQQQTRETADDAVAHHRRNSCQEMIEQFEAKYGHPPGTVNGEE
ncbi:hypothetical protein BH688_05845 [Kushneria phosphatilytica]|nr:hypothetical protein BH688_05845 [Kushneria phosphatilytica]